MQKLNLETAGHNGMRLYFVHTKYFMNNFEKYLNFNLSFDYLLLCVTYFVNIYIFLIYYA